MFSRKLLTRIPTPQISKGCRLFSNIGTDNILRSKFRSDELENEKHETTVPKVVMKHFNRPDMRDKIALQDGFTGETATYGQLYLRAYSCAYSLQKNYGVKSDVCVGILSPNHVNFFTAFHGIALTGGFSTTINPLYVEEEIELQLKITKAAMLIAHPLCMPKALIVAKKLNITVLALGDKVDGAASFNDLLNVPIENINPNSFGANGDIASLMTLPFSSGTTGLPKVLLI